MRFLSLGLLFGIISVSSVWAESLSGPFYKRKQLKDPIPFVSTPQSAVEKMVEMASIQPGDVVYDLGCGDGRIPVFVSSFYGIPSFGIDIDPNRVAESISNASRANVENLVVIRQGDIFEEDLSNVDVVFLYLEPKLNERLLPQLMRMKSGSRIVTYEFPLPDIEPTEVFSSEFEGGGRTSIFKYLLPLEPAYKLEWVQRELDILLPKYQSTYPIQFIGLNKTGKEMRIRNVISDCSSCINISFPKEPIPPGGQVQISGEVVLRPLTNIQVGSLALRLESGFREIFKYIIKYPPPYSLSPGNLVWGDSRESKTFKVRYDADAGYEFLSYTLDSDAFDVKVINSQHGQLEFQVIPTVDYKTKGTVFLKFKTPGPPNSLGSRPPDDKIFVTLSLEENSS